MKWFLTLALLAARPAGASMVWSQAPGTAPAGTIPSQFWFDPTGQNNLDSDAAAYDAFTISRATSITHVEWWGDGAASVGFFITFYNQDTNTVAYQPDLVQFHGRQPVATEEVTNYTQTALGNGLYHYSAELMTPVKLEPNSAANPRYFLSIVDSMPQAYFTWGWTYATGGDGKLFYFQLAGSLAGGPYYTIRNGDLAFVLGDATPDLKVTAGVGGTVLISWPTNSIGYLLEESLDLSRNSWVGSSNIINPLGDRYQIETPNPVGARFYRLRHP